MFFFARPKNLNWEILTKNLVLFKRWDGVKDEDFEYYGGSLKISIFRGAWGGGVHENPICRGGFSKKGWGLGLFAKLSGGLGKKRGVVFLRGADTPMDTMAC